jgi:hypothetical protein
MNPLIPCHCHKCGVIGESRLSWAGPHIKQSCPECGAYQKFIDKSTIPDVKEIKVKIWGIVNGSVDSINFSKKEIEFVENLTGLYQKLEYYRLFRAIQIHTSL